ncbi:MAG: hypothetical protein IBX36_02170 [Dehalococcoidia bacterium]|nr:hypothetical protein [Dehalococcoidia bacterium]
MEKALISVYAADKHGVSKLEYQLYHALIFYLAKVKEFKFPGYSFAAFSWDPYGSTLISRKLAADTGILCAKGLLRANSPAISISQRGRETASAMIPLLEEDEGKPYEEFRQAIEDALDLAKETPTNFLRTCYSAYIREL